MFVPYDMCVCVFIYMYWNACCNYAEKSSKTSLLTLGVFLLITGLFSPLPGLLQHDPVLEFPIIGISPAGRCIDKYIYVQGMRSVSWLHSHNFSPISII